jgi:hypothetical protein
MVVRKAFAVVVCGTLLWAGPVLAALTAQQKCAATRVTAWRKYVSCVGKVHAKQTDSTSFAVHFAPFAKCRHKYFGTWPKIEQNASLLGTSCNLTDNSTNPPDPRFTDNGDMTVTDNLTGLAWEKKNTVPGSVDNVNNTYTWSTGTNKEDGSAFTTFLRLVNSIDPTIAPGLGGSNGWRLPTLAEIQTILLDFACVGPSCRCPSSPCIDPALGPVGSSCWSATSLAGNPSNAWTMDANGATFGGRPKTNIGWVRAVRGGL